MRRVVPRALLWVALGAVLAAALQPRLLAPLLGVQGRLLAPLLPDFRLTGPWLAPGAAGWRVGVRLVSSRYLMLQGRAQPPGLEIMAQAPATLLLRPLALFLAGALMLTARAPRSRRLLATSMAALLFALALLPLLLAGQAWAPLDPGHGLARLSEALLDGGDVAVAVLLLALALRRPRMVLSDQGRA